ncbi:serine/arginine repetitive matrix protein 2-like [Mizuhopecten yessoensis]|uniref:Uncharacterized protein n=1 Tax=Mizuhopecten yessoensis TaxID=6573 RepID=A0A210Q4I1_MIZYE|nr:serine/arginine repetitive matrix protein 2-like [Mizuhopecten yessoensis]OWF43589.1 hypothetical protein KP79_PYT11234 [Mizuhopecten yessoensis]
MALAVVQGTSPEIETEIDSARTTDTLSPKSKVSDTSKSSSGYTSSDSETQTQTETVRDTEHGISQPPKPSGSSRATISSQETVGNVGERREEPKQSIDNRMLQISTSSCSRSSSYSSKDSLSADTRTAMTASVDRPLSSFDEDLQGDITYSTCQTMTTTLTEPQQLQSNESVQAARKRHAISLGTSPPQKRRSPCPLSLQRSHSPFQRSRSSSPPSPPQQFPPKPPEQSPAPLVNADSGHFNSSSIFTKSETELEMSLKEDRTFIDKDQEELDFPFQHSESKQQDAQICIQRTPRTETSSDCSSDLHVSDSEIQTETTVSKSTRCAEAPSPKSEINVTPRSRSSNFSSDSETQPKTETDTDTEHGVPLPPKPPGSNIATVIVQKVVSTVEKRKGSKQSPDIDCILEIVKKQNIDDFKTLEKRLTTTDRKRILHIVVLYGSADMVECMKTWDWMEWNEECTIPKNVFGEALKGISVSKATALYLATFMDKTEMVSKLINCAGEDNIKYCFKNLELSDPMETEYMLNLAQLLKREHSELEPAIIPGHRVGKDGERKRVFIVYSKKITNASCK